MGKFKDNFNARNPLKSVTPGGKGATYSSATQSPLGYSPLKQTTMTKEEIEALEQGMEEKASEGQTGKNIGLLPSEDPGTWVYDGTDKRERIIGYEERISFIEEDIWNTQTGSADAATDENQATDQQKQDLATLRAELAKLRNTTESQKKQADDDYTPEWENADEVD